MVPSTDSLFKTYLGGKVKVYKQQGFTLIELIMVIVILGILAAVALPKFADLSGDARKATMQGALGSVKSAAAIVHAKAIAEGKTTTNESDAVVLEGVKIVLSYGYPAASSVADAAGIKSPDYYINTEKNVTTISATKDAGASAVSDCNFTYTQPESANLPPTISDIANKGC